MRYISRNNVEPHVQQRQNMQKTSMICGRYQICGHFRGRLQRTSGKWGGGVVLKFRTFPDGGRGVVCESSDVRKFLEKNRHSKISQSSLKLKLEIIIDRDSNMRAFKHDVCSNLGVNK